MVVVPRSHQPSGALVLPAFWQCSRVKRVEAAFHTLLLVGSTAETILSSLSLSLSLSLSPLPPPPPPCPPSLCRGVIAASHSDTNSRKTTANGIALQCASSFQLQMEATYSPTLVVAEFVRVDPSVPVQLAKFPRLAADMLATQVLCVGGGGDACD